MDIAVVVKNEHLHCMPDDRAPQTVIRLMRGWKPSKTAHNCAYLGDERYALRARARCRGEESRRRRMPDVPDFALFDQDGWSPAHERGRKVRAPQGVVLVNGQSG